MAALPSVEGKQYGPLSDFQHPAVFPSEFSVLPLKSSEYLRADFPSDANTREMRAVYKLLDSNDLHSEVIFPSCEMHRFGT